MRLERTFGGLLAGVLTFFRFFSHINKMTHQLTLHDIENDRNYILMLGADDYHRALSDQAFASTLLVHAKCAEDGLSNLTDNKTESSETETEAMKENEGGERTNWTKDEILQLINIYKDNEHRYKSTTVRKEIFWSEVASKIGTKTAEQARNKFKYLKSMYMKTKDNMSSKATGKKKVHFSYFEDMDRIFARQPNVTPVATASSSKCNQEAMSDLDIEQTDEKVMNTSKAKPEKNKIPEQLKELKELLTLREENAERRHKENLERKDKALEKVNELLTLAFTQKKEG